MTALQRQNKSKIKCANVLDTKSVVLTSALLFDN